MVWWHYVGAVLIGLVVFDAMVVAMLAYAARKSERASAELT